MGNWMVSWMVKADIWLSFGLLGGYFEGWKVDDRYQGVFEFCYLLKDKFHYNFDSFGQNLCTGKEKGCKAW